MATRTRPPARGPRQGLPALEIPLPDDGLGSESYWRDELHKSEERVRAELKTWQRNLERYRGDRPELPNLSKRDQIGVNLDFSLAENKRAQLFFQTPFVQATAKREDCAAAAPVFQQILNDKLGAGEIDAKRLMDDVLMDILVPAGLGATKIGYDCLKVPKTMPTGRMVPQLDPVTHQPMSGPMGPAMTPALNPDGSPETTTVPFVAWSQYYWARISPVDLRLPVSFLSTHYDKAPWIGHRFKASTDFLDRAFDLPAGTASDVNNDLTLAGARDRKYLYGGGSALEVWYRASLFDETEKNPERIRRLVLIEGRRSQEASVLLHQNSPYQQFGPDGDLQNGMRGFPIHVLAIRPMSDCAYPPSDCTVSRMQVDELSRGRSQMMRQRDRNVPMRAVNKQSPAFSKNTVDQLERGDVQSIILTDGPIQETDFKALDSATFPEEKFEFDSIIRNDAYQLWGVNPAAAPPAAKGVSATGAQLAQQPMDTRLANERECVLSWFVAGVDKLAALIQIFQDTPDIVRIVGPNGQQALQTWDKTTVQGRFAFDLKPDSSVRVDAAEERETFLRAFNLLANAQGVNVRELIQQVAVRFNMDPSRVMMPLNPNPPTPLADKPRITVNITPAADLNPQSPQYTNVIHLLNETGITGLTAPQVAPVAPPPLAPRQHAQRRVEPVSQHDADNTGARPGPKTPIGVTQ